ncbi:hypothetical protein [Syntrophobotulus glycolicus]|uniref:hypothetical protein n=1 Tax=Syntrophobotulus glycolicus TaxID=51197 RepID=UPI0002F6EDB6|nr:hypothetical protein [Syntrophobotulus glycolicus]
MRLKTETRDGFFSQIAADLHQAAEAEENANPNRILAELDTILLLYDNKDRQSPLILLT